MTDVHDLLARTHRALGDGVTLDDARHDALLSGIRRRRRRRHAAEVLGVSALVVVLGAGGWFGLTRGDAPQPAQTTSPTPTVSPTPDADAAPRPAPHAPGLLPALVMPPGTLEASTPGWVLTVQEPAAAGTGGATAHVVDVVAPDGTRYRVVDLAPDLQLELVRWDAGSTQALVVAVVDGTRTGARLDLLTGEVTPLAGLADVSGHVGRTAEGDVWDGSYEDGLVVHDGTGVVRTLPGVDGAVLDASGARLAGTQDGATLVVDVATGGSTEVTRPGDDLCGPLAWAGADLLVWCETWDGDGITTTLWRYDGDDLGGTGVQVDVPEHQPTATGRALADGRVAVQHSRLVECTRGWGLLDPATGTVLDMPLDGADSEDFSVTVQASGDVVLATVRRSCSEMPAPLEVERYDAATGTRTVLAPAPPADELPAGADRWDRGTTSAVIAG